MFPEWYSEAERLYVDKKMSYTQIGKILSVGRKTISHYLRKGGHESNLKFYPNIDASAYRKYMLNEEVFDVIDSEDKAYWLGFIYADGNVSDRTSDMEITLKEEDYSHLEKLRDFFETDKPIYEKDKVENGITHKGYRLIICSKRVKESLISLGCTPKKSDALRFPGSDQVPDELLRHFIRGYFDGDGCITKANGGTSLAIELLGTEDMLNGYLNWSGRNHGRIHGFNHVEIVKRVQHFGEEARHILNQLYQNSSVYLERKYNRYQDYVLPS